MYLRKNNEGTVIDATGQNITEAYRQKQTKVRWTSEDDRRLEDIYRTSTYKVRPRRIELAFPDRSLVECQKRWYKLNKRDSPSRQNRAWTKEEEQFLTDNYKTKSNEWIGKKLGRTHLAVLNRRTLHGYNNPRGVRTTRISEGPKVTAGSRGGKVFAIPSNADECTKLIQQLEKLRDAYQAINGYKLSLGI